MTLAIHAPTDYGPWASIDLTAITHNLAWMRRRMPHARSNAHPPRLWAVVKADAYGHGLHHALGALGASDGVAVATLGDVLRVRELGWHRPVLLLSAAGLDPSALGDPACGELHIVIDDNATLQRLEHMPFSLPRVHAWLRYAGHLQSQGFDDTGYPHAFWRLQALAQNGRLAAAGHLHHYAMAEDAQALATEQQAFARVTAGLPGPHSTGNSAALCGVAPGPIHPAGHWLRCGLALYGASALPGRTGAQLGLRPAMSLHARLLVVRRVAAGQSVGYGDSYRAAQDTHIGVVGIGYGHGLPRNLWRHGQLLAGKAGRPVPLAGRVAMDCLTVDLGSHPTEKAGDIITLWGQSPAGAALPVEAAAQACDTIAAEMLTCLTARLPLLAYPKAA
ncbi:MAG: alanine racemase [Burkholderiaceae bacterium]